MKFEDIKEENILKGNQIRSVQVHISYSINNNPPTPERLGKKKSSKEDMWIFLGLKTE